MKISTVSTQFFNKERGREREMELEGKREMELDGKREDGKNKDIER